MRKRKNQKTIKKLKATIIFDKKTAQSYSKTDYYRAQQKNMMDWDHIQKEKTINS
jgi:hypothetical protein